MKKNLLIIVFIFLLTILTQALYSSSVEKNYVSDFLPENNTAIDKPSSDFYNSPARVQPCGGWNWLLRGAFLYWKASEEGLSPGWSYSTKEHEILQIENNPIKQHSNYNSGFKVGIGFQSSEDKWEINFKYLRFKNTNSSSKDISENYSSSSYLKTSWINQDLPISIGLEDKYFFEKGKWDLNYNVFDCLITRPSFQAKKLILTPVVGVRAGWADQKYLFEGKIDSNDVFDNILTFESRNSSTSWLVGPCLGASHEWILKYGLSLFSDCLLTIFYQKFKNTLDEFALKNSNSKMGNSVSSKNNISLLNPDIEFSFGLEYGKYFYHSEWHLNLSLGYDFIYLWNQNTMSFFAASSNDLLVTSKIGNLMLHGLNFCIKIDF